MYVVYVVWCLRHTNTGPTIVQRLYNSLPISTTVLNNTSKRTTPMYICCHITISPRLCIVAIESAVYLNVCVCDVCWMFQLTSSAGVSVRVFFFVLVEAVCYCKPPCVTVRLCGRAHSPCVCIYTISCALSVLICRYPLIACRLHTNHARAAELSENTIFVFVVNTEKVHYTIARKRDKKKKKQRASKNIYIW